MFRTASDLFLCENNGNTFPEFRPNDNVIRTNTSSWSDLFSPCNFESDGTFFILYRGAIKYKSMDYSFQLSLHVIFLFHCGFGLTNMYSRAGQSLKFYSLLTHTIQLCNIGVRMSANIMFELSPQLLKTTYGNHIDLYK